MTPESFWTNERIGQRHDAIFTECRRDNLEPQAALSKCMELSYTIAQDSYEELHKLRATIERQVEETEQLRVALDEIRGLVQKWRNSNFPGTLSVEKRRWKRLGEIARYAFGEDEEEIEE